MYQKNRCKAAAIVLCFSFILAATTMTSKAANLLTNVLFTPGDSTEPLYLYKDASQSSTQDGQLVRYADGTNYMIYKLPLNQSASQAHVVLTLSQNYLVSVSTDAKKWTTAAAAPGCQTAGQVNDSNKGDVAVDVMPQIKAGASNVYIKIGDQTTGNGWGGKLWSVWLTYSEYTPDPPVVMATAKTNFFFITNTGAEKPYIYQDNGSQYDGMYRYCDNENNIIYRFPYNTSQTAYVTLDIAANYLVSLSDDAQNWTVVAAEPKGKTAKQMEKDNRLLVVLNLNRYKNQKIDFVYLKVGDQTPANGWGGALYSVRFHYGSTGIYDPFDLSSVIKVGGTAANIFNNSAIYSQKTVPAGKSPLSDAAEAGSVSTQPQSSLSSSVSDVQAAAVSGVPSTPVSRIKTRTVTTQHDSSGNLWYIVIGAAAILLAGGAVTQLILLERKRLGSL